MKTGVHDLELLVRSRAPIVVETAEEPRALELLRRLAVRLAQPVLRWIKQHFLADPRPAPATYSWPAKQPAPPETLPSATKSGSGRCETG
jgi:hypothetical protein